MWLAISSTVCTISTPDYGTFDVLFRKQYATNDWQQYSVGLEGRQFLIAVFLSFAGIVRGEEGVSV